VKATCIYEDFSEVVLHNEGKFFITDRKLSLFKINAKAMLLFYTGWTIIASIVTAEGKQTMGMPYCSLTRNCEMC